MQRINERIELIRKRVNNFEQMINSVSKNYSVDKSIDVSPIKPISYINGYKKSSKLPNKTQAIVTTPAPNAQDEQQKNNHGRKFISKMNLHQTTDKTETILSCGSPAHKNKQNILNTTRKSTEITHTIFDPNEPLTDSDDEGKDDISHKSIATNTNNAKFTPAPILKNTESQKRESKPKQIVAISDSDSDSEDLDIESIRRRVQQRRQKEKQNKETTPQNKRHIPIEKDFQLESQIIIEDKQLTQESIKPIRTSEDIDREFKILFSDATRSEYARKNRDNFLEFWVDDDTKNLASKSELSGPKEEESSDSDLKFSISTSESDQNSEKMDNQDDKNSGYDKFALTEEEKQIIFSDSDDQKSNHSNDATETDDDESLEELLENIDPMDMTPTPIITPTKDMHVTVHTPKGSVVISPRRCPPSPPVSSFVPQAALVPSPRAGEKGRAVALPESPPNSSDEEFFGSDEEVEEEDEFLSWRKDPSVLDFDSYDSSLIQQLAMIDDIDDGSD